MSQPQPAIDGVLANESGTPIENDNGRGLSMWGITSETVSGLGLHWTEDHLRYLTREQAELFYLQYFWLPSNIGRIADQALANKLLDLAVNMGQRTAIKLMQGAVGVPKDGVLGPQTAEAVNAMEPARALSLLRTMAQQHYLAIVAANPSLDKFYDGWMARLDRA
jgi:type VI secretion system secreted protein VgrG